MEQGGLGREGERGWERRKAMETREGVRESELAAAGGARLDAHVVEPAFEGGDEGGVVVLHALPRLEEVCEQVRRLEPDRLLLHGRDLAQLRHDVLDHIGRRASDLARRRREEGGGPRWRGVREVSEIRDVSRDRAEGASTTR